MIRRKVVGSSNATPGCNDPLVPLSDKVLSSFTLLTSIGRRGHCSQAHSSKEYNRTVPQTKAACGSADPVARQPIEDTKGVISC